MREKTEKETFIDFLSDRWKTWDEKTETNGDTIISKDFIKNKEDFYIIARFSKSGNFCGLGWLLNGSGEAIINGGGFSFDDFCDFLRMIL